jgi:hypothetical protein
MLESYILKKRGKMKEFRIYQTEPWSWEIEVDGFNFDGLTFDTMNAIADFLLSLGYEEIIVKE